MPRYLLTLVTLSPCPQLSEFKISDLRASLWKAILIFEEIFGFKVFKGSFFLNMFLQSFVDIFLKMRYIS